MITITKFQLLLLAFGILLGNTNMIAQPVNDLIENATDLALGPIIYLEQDVDFLNATEVGDGGQQGGCNIGGLKVIWYKFTATQTGIVTASITSENGALTTFYSAPNEDVTETSELTFVNTQNNSCNYNSPSSIEAQVGMTYYVAMRNNETSDLLIDVSLAFAAPENDHITNAIDINGLEDYVDPDIHFLNTTTTDDGGQSDCNSATVPGIWYKFTAEVDGQVVAGIGAAPDEAIIIFYSAPNENVATAAELTHIDQPSNICGANNLSLINAEAGVTYYIIAYSILPKATISINLSGVLSVTDSEINGFTYYPNPVTSEINLEAITIIDTLVIYNILGQQVFSEIIGATQKRVNLANLDTGLYLMHVTSEGATESIRIIKE